MQIDALKERLDFQEKCFYKECQKHYVKGKHINEEFVRAEIERGGYYSFVGNSWLNSIDHLRAQIQHLENSDTNKDEQGVLWRKRSAARESPAETGERRTVQKRNIG